MSWRTAQLVRDDYQGRCKLLLLTMALYADDRGGSVFASARTLAENIGQSERHTRRMLAELLADGTIEQTKTSKGGTLTNTAAYRINTSGFTPDTHVTHDTGVTPDADVTPDTHVMVPLTPMSATPDTHVTRKVIEREHEREQEVLSSNGNGHEEKTLVLKSDDPPEPKRISLDRINWRWDGITAGDRARWSVAYPGVNIESELARMIEWIRAKKKNYTNWLRFITTWLGKSQDKAGITHSNGTHTKPARDPAEVLLATMRRGVAERERDAHR